MRSTKTNDSPGTTKVIPIRGLSHQLEGLYARRSAVEALIRSLEDYDRFRVQMPERNECKTA